ncbi:asparagine--tRNA ligase [Geothermobacter hydrogeniphilus]|uniref:Asparagine--tRNA ligase n=1 Tax=Geothermobacter hydrogeniphilus TaxID=1969733 RepID=A0A1X0Y440_9BACT|nr:asparagine--tRNA ligase [Geothermobacter hydrogeniphilus]ORJ59824.1 asparagine--tRNA ligase [Geothermobacter hydrogeniphilus]
MPTAIDNSKVRSVAEVLRRNEVQPDLCVRGWVRTLRRGKEVSFIAVNDGSCFAALQVVAATELLQVLPDGLGTGAAVAVRGNLVASPAAGQAWELQATAIELIGPTGEDYPLQKKRHSFEFLRSIAHLRPRTNSFGAVFRVRSRLAYAVHRFFQERGFLYVQTPIITASDCEGAGELFRVTTLDMEKPPKGERGVDYRRDFFGQQAGLTVSGQLEAELFATAFSNVYTFGPTFRAENSNTSRHAAEFWMIEPEIAFCDLAGNCDLAEDFMRAMVTAVLEECREDLDFFDQQIEKGLIAKLEALARAEFARMSYSEAVAELEKSGKTFEFPVRWGADLQSEHERFLTEEVVGGPLFVTDYPKQIKAFYMRMNDDDRTVAAMDLLVPRVGEIVGGSQREERLDRLDARMAELGMDAAPLWWYRDIRRWGSCPHAGFGLGFERLLMYVTGMENIRDVIPFPRTPGHAEF